MEQNKDQGSAAVRGEAVAESEPTGLPPISMSTYGTKTACELEHLRRTQRVGPDNLPRWVDNMKGSDPTIDSLIEYIVSARAADAPSEPSEQQNKTIDCMDAWATSIQMPTYTELHSLTEQYDALIRKICFQYAAGGYNSDGFMAPKSADLKLRWIIDEAYKSPSRAADALDSQPTEPEGCDECRHTYCLSGETCKACGDVNGMQGWKGGRQPTDGGVRNG